MLWCAFEHSCWIEWTLIFENPFQSCAPRLGLERIEILVRFEIVSDVILSLGGQPRPSRTRNSTGKISGFLNMIWVGVDFQEIPPLKLPPDGLARPGTAHKRHCSDNAATMRQVPIANLKPCGKPAAVRHGAARPSVCGTHWHWPQIGGREKPVTRTPGPTASPSRRGCRTEARDSEDG